MLDPSTAAARHTMSARDERRDCAASSFVVGCIRCTSGERSALPDPVGARWEPQPGGQGPRARLPRSARRPDGRGSIGQPVGLRKVRAPQRKVVGNAHPPRGEDQRHSDDAGESRSETRQALPGARPNRRATPGLPGTRALHSPRVGRMSRRVTGGPRWMAIVRTLRRPGTELGLQAVSLTTSSGRPPRFGAAPLLQCRPDLDRPSSIVPGSGTG
jgi:hypothetical protein